MNQIEILERLQALLDAGTLTEAEFEAAKRRTLRRNRLPEVGAVLVVLLLVGSLSFVAGGQLGRPPSKPVPQGSVPQGAKIPAPSTPEPKADEVRNPLLDVPLAQLLRQWIGKYPFNAADVKASDPKAHEKSKGRDLWSYPQIKTAYRTLLIREQRVVFWEWDFVETPVTVVGSGWAKVWVCKAHECSSSNMTLYVNLETGDIRGCYQASDPETDSISAYWIVPREKQVPLKDGCRSVPDDVAGDFRPEPI
jgi:hypothetical protein